MQSTTSSTRTFITPSPAADKPVTSKKRAKHFSVKRALPWGIVGILVVASAFLLIQYRGAQAELKSGNAATQQLSSLIGRVRKLVILPADETPTVATVVNAAKLHSQTFFANAQDGDKVLVYSKEKEAILYRPATNQIVTIAPVSVTSKAGSSAASLAGQQTDR